MGLPVTTENGDVIEVAFDVIKAVNSLLKKFLSHIRTLADAHGHTGVAVETEGRTDGSMFFGLIVEFARAKTHMRI